MAGGGGGSEELNLVPYLDIMVNLIMFLITVTAYMAEMRQAPVLAPGGDGGQCANPPCEDKPKVFLTVAVAEKTIAIVSSDREKIPASQVDKTGSEYPYAALTAKMREYRTNYPDLADNVMLIADKPIPYSAIISTMDAMRSDSQGDLFPGVTLGVAVK